MLAGRGVGPFAGRTRTGIGSGKPHIEAAPRRVHDIANNPVTAAAMPVREVMTAQGLGVAREAARQIGGAQHRTCPGLRGSAGLGAEERVAIEEC
jgi:hypothetical protein